VAAGDAGERQLRRRTDGDLRGVDEDSPMPFIAIAPTVRPRTVLGAAVDHYALLRTTEEMLGLPTLLGAAAQAPSMRTSLHL